MLKSIRVFLAIVSIIAVTLLFVDFTGTARAIWPWLAEIQLIPAILSANLFIVLGIVVLTLIFGRVYCSVICPLGIFQDVVSWIRGHVGPRKSRINRFKYVPAHTSVRLVILTVFVVLLILGFVNVLSASIASLIEPYSAYGRIATSIFAPAYDSANNMLASISEGMKDNYMFYRVAIVVSIPVLVVAIATLVTVVIFAWRGGRDYCNTVCPVGTVLGYIAKYSIFKPVIDTKKCINCTKCARRCKAKCINAREHQIDYSRCVACMDCISTCSEGAIAYTYRRTAHKPSTHDAMTTSDGRRAFMVGAGMVAGSIAMESLAKVADGGLTPLKDKQPVRRDVKVVPAGALSHSHLSQHCTACQLCIQACPQHVLKASTSLETFMQPEMDFTNGFCDVSCTRCADICPLNAITPIDTAEKSSIKIGTAVVDIEACLAASVGERCGNCARQCPTGAIRMVPVHASEPDGPKMPIVDDSTCIGCGRCEYYCPVGSVSGMEANSSAIHVEGLDMHRMV